MSTIEKGVKTFYTDGACSGNGTTDAPGGWAWALERDGEVVAMESGSLSQTTNNIAELTAILRALQYALAHEVSQVRIASDSAYCINGVTSWMHNWKRNDWTRPKGQVLKNKELWQEIYALTQQVKVEWIKVAGHSGDYFNELVDTMAKERVVK